MSRLKAHLRGRRVAQVLLTSGVVASTALMTALPANATWKATYGTFSNNVTYFVEIDVTSSYVSAHANTSSAYSEGSLHILMCSGTGDCSAKVVMASNRNYSTTDIYTGNPPSFGHTYKACFSARFGTTSYSNYCTPLAAP